MAIQKVALVGANGRLGRNVLDALLAAQPSFDVTIVARASSKSEFPSNVRVVRVSDGFTTEELVPALTGQDAVIVTVTGNNSDIHFQLADVAAQIGVKRFIPPDFGSCDSSSPRPLELLPLYRNKAKLRSHLQQLASTNKEFSWTSLVPGHFFDYLKEGLLQFFPDRKYARIFDGGETKWSATTLETVAKATVAVLRKDDETKNQVLFVESFLVTQNQILKILEKVTGGKWDVEHVGSEEFIVETKKKLDANSDDHDAKEDLVGVLGISDGNWEKKQGFANDLLGLKEQDLEDAVRKALSG